MKRKKWYHYQCHHSIISYPQEYLNNDNDGDNNNNNNNADDKNHEYDKR